LGIWRPFKAAGRLLGKLLVPPYIRSSLAELRQVTWPDRKQTLKLTSAVLIFALTFGLIVALVDFGLDKLFKQVILR
jgi:preprotein translocase SecE subunit